MVANLHRQRHPDDVSKKSLKVLDKKLQLLARTRRLSRKHQLCGWRRRAKPQDALTIGKRALELGFTSTIGIIHDGDGQLQPLRDEERRVYHEMKAMEKSSFTRINRFQDNIAQGLPNQWRCRAGARYLYICENGLVHYCSQQRGYPGIPLEKYTVEDIRREYLTEKCALRIAQFRAFTRFRWLITGAHLNTLPRPCRKATTQSSTLVQIE